MIGTIEIECQAKNPNMPLWPLRAYVNSPSSLRIRNVPKKIGKWSITKVTFAAIYPDNTTKSVDCVLTGGVWVGTIEGSATAGTYSQGYTIFADGTDENGNAVTGYVLGKGDIVIMQADGTPEPEPATTFVKLQDDGTGAEDGDIYPTENGYVIQQNGEAHQLGTSFEQITAYVDSQVSSKADLTTLNDYATTTALNEGLELKADLSILDDYALKAELSNKADLSAIHGDYIQDSAGNKIQANRNAIEISTYYVVNAFYSDTLGEFVDEREGIWSNDSYNAFISADSQTIGKWNVWIEDFYIVGEPKNAVGYFFTTNGEVIWTEGDLVGDRSIAINTDQSQQQTAIYMKLASEFYAEELTRQLSNDIEVELSAKVDLSTLADYSTKAELANKADLSSLDNYATTAELANKADLSSVTKDQLTFFNFGNNDISAFDWSGEINQQTMVDVGLFDGTQGQWIKSPVEVSIGNKVTSIGNSAFEKCYGTLSSVTIPNSVSSLGSISFAYCDRLTSLTLPESIASIGNQAFYGAALDTLTFRNKSLAQISAMTNYDWSLAGTITTQNDPSFEWIYAQLSALEARIAALEGN